MRRPAGLRARYSGPLARSAGLLAALIAWSVAPCPLTAAPVGPVGAVLLQDPPDSVQLDSASLDSAALDSLQADSLPAPEEIDEERLDEDEAIRSSLQAIFDRVPSLMGVRVAVEAGIVRLTGTVVEDQVRERAVQLTEEQEGVLWVEDEIRMDTSLSHQLQPTWDRLRELAWGFIARLPLFAVALAIVAAAFFVGTRLGKWGGPAWLRSKNPFLRNLIGRAIQAVIFLTGIVIALDLLEATALVGAIAGGAGLAGIALGFAFQDIVENYLAGVLLAVRQPFDADDHVVVEGQEGKIVRLTPRETILMTMDGNHVSIPNGMVFGGSVLNYTRNPRRRFQFEVGVGPSDDLALARTTGLEVLHQMAGVLDDPPPESLVIELGESWVTVRFLGWVDQRQADFGKVRSEAIRLVKRRLEVAGVSLPSPEYLVRLTGDAPAAISASTGNREADSRKGPAPSGVVVEDDFSASDVREEQGDISRDDSVDRQIAEDRLKSGEEDLLDKDRAVAS